MRMAPVQLDSFTLQGGLNLVTPPLSMPPGMCRDAQNFEIGTDGGYRRVGGYVRFDGKPSPVDAVYYILPCSAINTAVITDGAYITGAVSGSLGVVIASTSEYAVLRFRSGSFVSGEGLLVGSEPAVQQGVASGAEVADGAPTPALHGYYKSLAAEARRVVITQVGSGITSGGVLGVVYFGGSVYAFRNSTDSSAALMFKATASGWTSVTTPALLPSGRYQFTTYNFGDGLKLYGCDGVNKAFEFDGTTFTQITTGMAADAPQCIAAHKNHLFLAFGNSLQHSGISDPFSWTPVLGASEINVGDTITGLKPQVGNDSTGAMAVYSRNTTRVLYGSSSANWQLVMFDPEAGAIANTVQHIGQTHVLDDRGITTLETTQNYGNFSAASISAAVRPYILGLKPAAIGSAVSRDKNQYRLFFSNGRALYYTIGKGFMPMEFPHNFTCFFTGEDTDGNEVSFAGGSDGYVYQFDKGDSFDGLSIDAFMVLVFNHIKSPRVLKRYRKAVLEVAGEGYAEFWVSADLGYASSEYAQIPISQLISELSAGRWDSGTWDAGVWDGRILSPSEYELTGSAENISLRIAQSSTWHAPLTFHSVMTSYTPRRLLR